jgi:hypothetical protein
VVPRRPLHWRVFRAPINRVWSGGPIPSSAPPCRALPQRPTSKFGILEKPFDRLRALGHVRERPNGPNTRHCVTRGRVTPPRPHPPPHPMGWFHHPRRMLGSRIYGLGSTNGRIGPWGWGAILGVLQYISGPRGRRPEPSENPYVTNIRKSLCTTKLAPESE